MISSLLSWFRDLFVEPIDPFLRETLRVEGYVEGPEGFFVRDWGSHSSRISRYQGRGSSWLVMIADARGRLIGPVRPFEDLRAAIQYAADWVRGNEK